MVLTKPQKLIYDMEKYSGGAIAVICGSVLRKDRRDLTELKSAVNELYRLNDALRTRIVEADGAAMQAVVDFTERDTDVLQFPNKAELEAYAAEYAKQPLDFHGNLCELKIVLLPDSYGLLAKLHHIIGDAWSLSLIASQFCAVLDGKSPAAYAYSEYAAEEAKYLESGRYEKDRAFFLEQFKKCDEVTYLSEKQSESLAAARKTFVIDAEQSRLISAYTEAHHTSPFMLFMAALSACMNRVKMNVEKFYIGTAVLNRTGVHEKNTVGMFINTVPMLIKLNNEQTFAENLSSIEASAFAVFRHQKYNYGDVLTDIRKEYGFSERLYDVMLSYQNAKITAGGDAESTWYHSGVQTESLQIHIDDRDGEGIFKIQYDYQTEKFTEQEINRLHRHICNLLFDAIANDSKRLYELDLLTADERQKLLFDFNDTAVEYPRDKCVHTLFEEQATRTPDKVAVIACDRTITYAELNEQANRIAHGLIAKGVGVGDIVAFALPRRSYLIAAMLGILKTGAAYLPVDPDHPKERIDYMLSDSGAKFHITDENIHELLENERCSNPGIAVSTSQICYCIYTSGSTGLPKGTLLKHANVANYVDNNNNNNVVHSIIKSDYKRIVSVTTVGFDIFVTESLLPLANGMQILLANEDQAKVQSELAALLEAYPADVLQTTPTKMKLLIANKGQVDYLHNLKAIILGGEALDSALVSELEHITDAEIFNIYGPTETTVWSTNAKITSSSDITIGKPIANTQIYILDKHLHPVPIGVNGELCITGNGVGEGYLNRPELTAEKFIENPFGAGKLYKTGDLAYWREDGNIVYVGRNDFQVKIRGLRIELGEIENAISAVDGVSQAVVVVRKDTEGRQLICAFYTDAELPAKDIRAAIGQKLPKYMLPHIFTHLEEMPLTSSGKINRKALPEVDLSSIDRSEEYVKPEGELEKRLAALMEEVLEYNPIGRNDDFFDLGGDSLKAIELISALESAGYHTDVKTLFANATVRALAPKLTAAAPHTEAVEITGDVPATPAQMRVYTAQAMQGGTAYNVPYAFRAESVEPDQLQKAVQTLVDRHEILRTHFEDRDGHIMQVVEPELHIGVEKLDSDDISAFVRPFDLSKLSLLRVGYFENTVMIDMHHIITDGGSMPVFLRELNELYMGRELRNPPVQYRQFAVQSQDSAEDEAYWLSVYSDEPPVLELNTDFKREQKRSYNGNALYASLDSQLHQKILAASRKLGVTPFAFYISGFYILLSKFSGNEDIVVGIPMSGREGQFLDALGMFVNTIALRNQPVGTKAVKDFLSEIREKSVAAMAHQMFSYNSLVKKLGLNPTDRNPLFDVMFAYQDEAMTDVVFGDIPAELLPIPVTTSKYDFTFNVMPRKDDVVVMAEYCTDLYRKDTMQRFLDGYRLILTQMLDGDILLKDISAITEQERQKLLFDFNDTAVDYPRDKCIQTLFEEQAQRIPNKIALKFGDKELTFSQLNGIANGLAALLNKHNVGRGDIVAIISKRSYHLVVAMLAIFKCGAAYLPIDYNYPEERISTIISDSDCKAVLTYDFDYRAEHVIEIPETINPVDENPKCFNNPEDICGIIYTSGSTGTPKGTLLKHRGLVNYTFANDALYNGGTCVLGFSIYTFDAFFLDTISPMLRGVTAVMATEEEQFSQIPFEDLIKQNPGCNLFITPAKFKQFIDNCNDKNFYQRIHNICIGGEVFPEEFIDIFSKNTNVFNVYGPTECSMWVLECPVMSSDVTLGKPLANIRVYICGKNHDLLPIGVTGELCIAGDGVGAGYLNRPELTAEKFIDNPFGEGRLYKTGDLAYWREDGNIVYVGRNDFQVKIRGLRIELGEIENAISAVEGVSQAVVVVRKDAEDRQLICAFYTGAELPAKEIRSIIGQKLPKYMLPHIITHMEEMPLTSSGKINRKALPEVDLSSIDRSEEYVKPEGKLEKCLAALMEEVLEYKPIGRNDNFFDLGGDSLRAIEFVSKAHSEGIYFALQSMFDHPTVRRLAERIVNGDKQQISYADVDFTKINAILAKNTVEHMQTPQETPTGNILLAGATGYLGIHILADFLEHDSSLAYCLVRGKDIADSEKRLAELLRFYFGDKYAVGNRIQVICADLQKDHFGLVDQDYAELFSCVDTVINAAASVKHYGSYKYFYETNAETVKRLIEFCKTSGAKLIHTSTLSVSGNSFADDFDGYVSGAEKHFYESNLYIGQPLDNVYARSKFEAEMAVLNAMNAGLHANIMRMGNLTNRLSDGVFQRNYESNAFLKRIKAILEMGVFPAYLLDIYAEFTPIDEAATAVMTIARHFSTEQTVFHINSTKVVYLDKLMEFVHELGYRLKTVSGTEFTKTLRQTAIQSGTAHIFETFINDMDANDRLVYDSNIHIENDFTVRYLRQLGFEWSEIGLEYLRKYMDYFRKIGYWEV